MILAKKIPLTESEEGFLFFDTEKCWFCFLDKDKSVVNPITEIGAFRIGHFDLTPEELTAMREWLRENLKDGVFQD